MTTTLEKKKDIIVSSRTFGVEVEAGARNGDNMDSIASAHRWLRLTSDSSVHVEGAVELVTPVLKGRDGAEKIIGMCKSLNELDFITDHESCGMHVHLDGAEFLPSEEVVVVEGGEKGVAGLINERGSEVKRIIHVAKDVVEGYIGKAVKPSHFISFAKELHQDFNKKLSRVGFISGYVFGIKENVSFGSIEKPVISISRVDQFDYEIADVLLRKSLNSIDKWFSKELLTNNEDGAKVSRTTLSKERKEKERVATEKYNNKISSLATIVDGQYIVNLEDKRPLKRVKALMYFYVGFNQVIQGMVAPSRKLGNAYCMPISDFFELDQIEELANYTQFEELWYKNGDSARIRDFKTQHYNDSRYMDVNLHSLFNRTGTVEIRLHGSTKDANQILLWTALHQHIVDNIASEKITLDMIKDSLSNRVTLEDKYQAMVELLALPEHLALYVKRLLNHFSNLNIN